MKTIVSFEEKIASVSLHDEQYERHASQHLDKHGPGRSGNGNFWRKSTPSWMAALSLFGTGEAVLLLSIYHPFLLSNQQNVRSMIFGKSILLRMEKSRED
jgi:hypothetical protein